MRTQTDIENQRHWVGIATVALIITYAFVAIAYSYRTLVEMNGGDDSFFAHIFASAVILLCLLPGIFLWRHLRPHSKYSALYGLLVSATICCLIPSVGIEFIATIFFGL